MHCAAAFRHAEMCIVGKVGVGQIESDAIRVPVREATHADAEQVGVRQHDGAIAVVNRVKFRN